MISESVYYMDRSHGALVTDHQVVVDGRRYDLELIKDARIKTKHSGQATRVEIYVRVLSMVTLLTAMAIRGFFWDSAFGQTIFELDIMIFTGGLVAMLFFGLIDRPRRVVVLRKVQGGSEELFDCVDTRYATEFVQAVTEAAKDCRAGHGGNARGVYRRK